MLLNWHYSLFVEWFDENPKKKKLGGGGEDSHFSLSPIKGEISALIVIISPKSPPSLILAFSFVPDRMSKSDIKLPV